MASDTSIMRSQVFFTAQVARYGVARSPRFVEKSQHRRCRIRRECAQRPVIQIEGDRCHTAFGRRKGRASSPVDPLARPLTPHRTDPEEAGYRSDAGALPAPLTCSRQRPAAPSPRLDPRPGQAGASAGTRRQLDVPDRIPVGLDPVCVRSEARELRTIDVKEPRRCATRLPVGQISCPVPVA